MESRRCAGTSGTGPRRTRMATAAVPKNRVGSSELRNELSIVVLCNLSVEHVISKKKKPPKCAYKVSYDLPA